MAEAAEAIAVERAVEIFTHYDFSENLAALGQESDVPVLLLHGDSDAGVPVEATIDRIKQMIPRAKINLYENAGHSTKASSPHLFLSMKKITNKCRSQSLSSLIPTDSR
jgi:pimeloyl-ACP methyl ester carboxylesterase